MNVSTTSALSVAAGSGLAETPASQRVEALAVLVLLVGVIQLLAGLFRLGFLIRFVSNAVMTGFLNGVAVLMVAVLIVAVLAERVPMVAVPVE